MEALLNEVDPYTTGRPRKVDLRELLNALYSLNKTGGPWRYLPKDFLLLPGLVTIIKRGLTGIYGKKSTLKPAKYYEKKAVEMRIPVPGLSIAHRLKELRNRPSNRDGMEGSGFKAGNDLRS